MLLAEGHLDISSRISRRLHRAVALALGNAAVQDSLNLLRRQLVAVWRTWLAGYLCTEGGLQIAGHMLIHSLFGISLHTAVDGGKHLQSIAVYIVWRTVFLDSSCCTIHRADRSSTGWNRSQTAHSSTMDNHYVPDA